MSYKKDFPIFTKNTDLVYLDSAATSQKPKVVLDAIMDFYTGYNANVKRGIYPIAEKATEKVEEVRNHVASFINARSSDEIIFVRNTTEAINLVMNTIGDVVVDFAEDNSVATTIMEHHSNFVPWQFLAMRQAVDFEVIDITADGTLDMGDLKQKIKYAKVLAITYISNMLGVVNDLNKIITTVRRITPKITIIVDAAQAAAHTVIDVQELDCDFLAFSGHKMFAGTGVGVLYGKKELLSEMAPFLFGGEMIGNVTVDETTWADLPHKFEAGTPDIGGIVSLGAAISYIEHIGRDTMHTYEQALLASCLSKLSAIEGVTIYGPKVEEKRGSVISFTLAGVHSHDIAQVLGDRNICIRAGHHCTMPLHKRLGIPASARVSFSVYNDEQDIERFIKGLHEAKKIFRQK